MLLSILIPAYQEERTIAEVLERVRAIEIEPLGFQKEIIVCDDGSTDQTVTEAKRIADLDDRIKIVSHEQNRGKGAAIRTALAAATGDYCIVQDADLEYEVTDYPAMLDAAKRGADVVYGSRFLQRSYPTGMRLPNYLANRILTVTSNALFGLGITDEATCLKLFRTELLKSLELACEGFEFCPEVTAKIGKAKVKVVEVPVDYTARNLADGKKVRWTDGVEALWVLVKHRLK